MSKVISREQLQPYLEGHPYETWREALWRFSAFCQLELAVLDKLDAIPDEVLSYAQAFRRGGVYAVSAPEPLANIVSYETCLNMSVPGELVELMCEHGSPVIRNGSAAGEVYFSLFDSEEALGLFPNIKPLTGALRFHGFEPFVRERMSAAQIAALDRNYFVFGFYRIHPRCYGYLLFDHDGRFGSFRFDEGMPPETLPALKRLCELNLPLRTLDDVVVEAINHTIWRLCEDAELPQLWACLETAGGAHRMATPRWS